MKTLNNAVLAFWQEESGLTIVEYALGGTLIAVGLVTALTTFKTTLATSIAAIGTAVTTAA
jgi:pilus assembly protein Flp/PilA